MMPNRGKQNRDTVEGSQLPVASGTMASPFEEHFKVEDCREKGKRIDQTTYYDYNFP